MTGAQFANDGSPLRITKLLIAISLVDCLGFEFDEFATIYKLF